MVRCFHDVTGEAEALLSLRVHSNRLRQLPANIERLTKLRLVEAGNNLLSKLPKQFACLTSLTVLSLPGK